MKPTLITIFLLLLAQSAPAQTDWQDNAYNWQNNVSNWENSPNNWKNSPNNYENNPNNYHSERIIRDNKGEAKGYMVPKDNGSYNLYDLEGNRTGYGR